MAKTEIGLSKTFTHGFDGREMAKTIDEQVAWVRARIPMTSRDGETVRAALLAVARDQQERDAVIAGKHIDGIVPYREKRLRGRKLGMLPDEAVAEITSEERGEKIAAEMIATAIRNQTLEGE